MCSLRGVNVITLAAIFCTRCNLRSKFVETPDNNTNSWMSLSYNHFRSMFVLLGMMFGDCSVRLL